MSHMDKVRTIHTELWKGSQDFIYTETLKVGPHTCQINIVSDAYPFQCHAVAKVWSTTDLRWNSVASIHYSQMATKLGLAFRLTVSADNFLVDRNNLAQQLLDVLG